jgi:enoyl-CoA hydratase
MNPKESLIIETRVDEHLLVLTINRFHRRNSFDYSTAMALEHALDRFDEDASLHCAILTGTGGIFSAGMDLIAAKAGEIAVTKKRGGFGIMEQPPRKPIIAAIEGHALAGGFELAMCCDLIVASSEATMGLPEVRWALIASGGGLFRLPRRIPYHVAMELALTARPQVATEFHRLGLVNRICEPGSALQTAIDLAREVLRNGPLSIEATAQIMRRSYDLSEEEAWAFQVSFTEQILASTDRIEGLTAFAEKRDPSWSAT